MGGSHPHPPVLELWACKDSLRWVGGNSEVSEAEFLQPAVSRHLTRRSVVSQPSPRSPLPAPPPLPPEQSPPRAGLVHYCVLSPAKLTLLDLTTRAEKGGLNPPCREGWAGTAAIALTAPWSLLHTSCDRSDAGGPTPAPQHPLPCSLPPIQVQSPCGSLQSPTQPRGAQSNQGTSVGVFCHLPAQTQADARGCPGPQGEALEDLRGTSWHTCSLEPRGEKSCTVG